MCSRGWGWWRGPQSHTVGLGSPLMHKGFTAARAGLHPRFKCGPAKSAWAGRPACSGSVRLWACRPGPALFAGRRPRFGLRGTRGGPRGTRGSPRGMAPGCWALACLEAVFSLLRGCRKTAPIFCLYCWPVQGGASPHGSPTYDQGNRGAEHLPSHGRRPMKRFSMRQSAQASARW